MNNEIDDALRGAETTDSRKTGALAAIVACLFLALLFGPPTACANAYEDFNRALTNDDVSTLTALLRKGMDPNTVNDKGEAALLAAAREGSPQVVKTLLQARAKVDVQSPFGDTPIMLAALRGSLPIVKLLREAGAQINRPGWTPLLYAALNGHNAVIEYLLSSGADLAFNAPNGVTPIMLAVRSDKADTLKLLISYGLDVNARNEKGESALDWARKKGSEDLETILRQAGAR